ncbi:MAG: sensor histidine kinase [Bacteroidota bacterium]
MGSPTIHITRPTLIRWGLSLLVWTVAGVLYAAQSYYYRTSVGQIVEWWSLLLYDGSYFLLWAPFSLIVVMLARRFLVQHPHPFRHFSLHVLLGIIVGIIHRATFDLVFMHLRQTVERPFTWERYYYSVIGSFDYGVLVYFIIVFVTHALVYYEGMKDEQTRVATLRGELANAQLQTLKMQLHPHFLFNTLNAISVSIDNNPVAARKTLGQLSDMLRLTLDHGTIQEVTLRKELTILEPYLAIQQTRFGERLTTSQSIDDAALDAYVPFLLLQPLVENAVQHGVATIPEPATLKIHVTRKDGIVAFTIFNSGPGISANDRRQGVGLTNTRARLAALYGSDHALELRNVSGGVEVIVEIPFRSTPTHPA